MGKRGDTIETQHELLIAAISFATGYTVHFVLLYGPAFRGWLRKRMPAEKAEITRVVVARSSLILLFLIPVFVARMAGAAVTPFDYVMASGSWGRAGVIAFLCGVIALLLAFNPGRGKLTANYPQMRISEWNGFRIGLNVGMWALYLLAYEWMFRGLLFFPLLPLGLAPAIALNTAIYVAVHVPKGITEAIGAVPFGVLACLMTYHWGSIWGPVVLHVALSVFNFAIALHESEEMQVVRAISRTARSESPQA